MSEDVSFPSAVHSPAETVLRLYLAVMLIMIVGIAVLVVYSIRLGPLVGPGVERSFGYALTLLFVQAAVLAHVVDRAYRDWPLGRRVHPTMPPLITDRTVATALKVVVLLAAAAAVAYLVGGLLAS